MNRLRNDRRLFALYGMAYLVTAVAIYVLQNDTTKVIQGRNVYNAASSALAPAALFVFLVEQYLWRSRIFRALLGIRIPHIRGRWEGYIRSTYTEHKVQHPVVVEFVQTLRYVRIWYFDENAVTQSLAADFEGDLEGGPIYLYCIYSNRPIKTDQPNLRQHHGAMELVIDPSTRNIDGIYYNNAFERATYGDIQLTFKRRKTSGRFMDATA